MRMSQTVLLLLVSACGTSGSTAETAVTPGQMPSTSRVVTGDGSALQINALNIDTDVRLFSTGTPEQVWAVLPAVYAELGIPLLVLDPATKSIGNSGYRVRRSLGKVPLYRYLDCGSSGTLKNAETYQINMSIMTTAHANPGGGTLVSTAITGTGKNPVTSSSAEVRCSSLGDLEIRIRDMVQKRVEAM